MVDVRDGERLRVLVCPDKFKGTLSAADAGDALAAGVRRTAPGARIQVLPIADGGEGTTAAALRAGASPRRTVVSGPLGAPVAAEWALSDDGTAVIESSAASGLAWVDPDPATARIATTRGTGELIRAAMDAGAERIILGLGGVATTDGGAGILQAMGVRLVDGQGGEVGPGGAALARVRRLDFSEMDPRWGSLPIILACDVDSPLTGPAGAAIVFAPQKGADGAAVAELDAALSHWADVLRSFAGASVDGPGTGAAGGIPAALLALGSATIASGFDTVAEMIGLREAVERADLVVTGEGSLDAQSLAGKGPVAVARLARAAGVGAIGIAGRVSLTAAEQSAAGFDLTRSLTAEAGSVAAAMAAPGRFASDATARAVGAWLRLRPA